MGLLLTWKKKLGSPALWEGTGVRERIVYESGCSVRRIWAALYPSTRRDPPPVSEALRQCYWAISGKGLGKVAVFLFFGRGGGGGYEELKACALAVVGCVCMGGEGERSVCCVGMFKITCKVPETSVV